MRVLNKYEELVEKELYIVVDTGLSSESHLIHKVGRCVYATSLTLPMLMIEHDRFFYDYEGGDRVATFDDACKRTKADACFEKV